MGLRKLLKSIVSGGEVVDIVNEAITQVDANSEGIKGLRGEQDVETASPKWSLVNLYNWCRNELVKKATIGEDVNFKNVAIQSLNLGGVLSFNYTQNGYVPMRCNAPISGYYEFWDSGMGWRKIACGDVSSNGNIYSTDGTIHTSDEAKKTKFTKFSEKHLKLARMLMTGEFKWLNVKEKYIEIEINKEIPIVKKRQKIKSTIELIDGRYVQKRRYKETFEMKKVDLYDESGNIIGTHIVPKTKNVLVKEKVIINAFQEEGKRYHWGFSAQDVAKCMKICDFDVSEYGCYVDLNHNKETNTLDLALRYEEFIPLLMFAFQDVDRRVQGLESKFL